MFLTVAQHGVDVRLIYAIGELLSDGKRECTRAISESTVHARNLKGTGIRFYDVHPTLTRADKSALAIERPACFRLRVEAHYRSRGVILFVFSPPRRPQVAKSREWFSSSRHSPSERNYRPDYRGKRS